MSLFNLNIHGLTPPILFELADHVHAFARQIEGLGNDNELQLSERRRNGNYKRSIKAASEYFSGLIEADMATDEALNLASEKYCVEREAVRLAVVMFSAKQKRIEKVQRDRKIMRSWRAGHPISQIAKVHKVTSRTVQRVVKEYKSI